MRLGSPELLADLKRGVPLAVVSGGLCGLAFYPFDLWWLTPVALVPLFLALYRTFTLRAAVYLTLLFGWVLAAFALHWMYAIFTTGALGVFLLVALPWALFGLTYRALIPRLALWAQVLLTPVLYLAMEWIRCQGWYFRFSWLQLGATYVAAEAAQSLYPLVGIYGMTFLTVLVNAAVATAWRQPSAATRLRLLALTAGLVVVLACGFRVAWVTGLSRGPQAAHTPVIRTLMMQSEDEGLDWYLAASREYLQARPQLLVWPELAINDYVATNPAILTQLQNVAREAGGVLVTGCKAYASPTIPCDWLRRRAMLQAEGQVYYNAALLLGPDGTTLGSYHKRHPIQFFADGVPGEGYPVFPTPIGPIGVAICYDFDFASTALSLTRHGAELLVVPTYDARTWGLVQQTQHARLALARAAEVGRWVVRPTSSGVSQIIAPGGEQVTYLPPGPSGHLMGLVERHTHLTPYVRWTWLLPYVCLVVSVVLLGNAFWGSAKGLCR